ncbi:isochorismatase family protein [Agrobacterium vitis]|uniref:isochorismatase family protein n=1 Tax=Agrobacterium vitis TaxID=373 RepID=UPI0015737676|nr:isochorismatase family protein [Agrobacterium vitis]NSZ16340.1 isochorismatase family protein [Agrobacterium vitis]QZO05095.1 isochorismatase family protein [Agrobacterium vitis]UJL87243.1 isochorismatase family protein [Agrobacterium vitis]
MKKALVVIDMQMYAQDRLDGGRDHVNGDAAVKIAALAAKFRENGDTVIHVHHGDPNPASPMHPGAPAQRVIQGLEPLRGEPVFVKSTSSPFASTDMENYLRDNRIDTLVVTGAVAGYCVNTTVRVGSDLGFKMIVVRDAVVGFDLPDENLSARVIFDVSMAHLKSDFANVVDSAEIITPLE